MLKLLVLHLLVKEQIIWDTMFLRLSIPSKWRGLRGAGRTIPRDGVDVLRDGEGVQQVEGAQVEELQGAADAPHQERVAKKSWKFSQEDAYFAEFRNF